MNLQKFFNDFKKNNKHEKVAIYGAGKLCMKIFASNNLEGINFVGIIDNKYTNKPDYKFFNIPTLSPENFENLDYDTLFVFLQKPNSISNILEKAKAASKTIHFFNEQSIPFEKNNTIILIQDGKERVITEDELPAGFSLNYTNDCKNNILKIELPHYLSAVTVHFLNTTDCYCEILSTLNVIDRLNIHFGESAAMKVKIGRNISVISALITTNQTKSEIEIGDDCMLASDVKIVGCDGHSIFDRDTGKLINIQKNKLHIGNHVWLGDHSRIMKNAMIPDGSVVGANSVVTKKYDEQNIILCGNPAKIVRHNVYWDRKVIKSLDENIL